MRTEPILVIDAGTSALRAVRVNADGSASTIASRPWQVFTPDDGSSFARELHAADVRAALAALVEQAAAAGGAYAGVALTGQREGVVFLDGAGAAVLVSPNIDGRASSEGMLIDERHGDELYAVTGHLPALMQAPAKLSWLRQQRPEAAERVRLVLPLVDWLGALLTGQRAASRTLAAEIGLVDVKRGDVASGFLEKLGVAADIVPPVVPDGDAIGGVRDGALAGLRVALAGADTQCALAGAGCLDSGTGVIAGWSAPLQMVTDTTVFDPLRRTWTGLHVRPGRWILESNAGECGRAWHWTVEMMGLSHDAGEHLAAASPAGSRDAMAILGPSEMQASGMTVGIGALTFPLPLVMSTPDRGDVLRSALEATAYALRANLEQLEDVGGARSAHVALGGGMSRSRLFARIVCDVTGRPVHVAGAPETSALGAAIIASPALGVHDTIECAASAMVGTSGPLEPDTKASAAYDDYYGRWQQLTRTMEQEFS